MEAFRSAHARGADWMAACDACLDRLGEPPPGANLGFLYAGDPFPEAIDHILARVRARTGIEDWVGTGAAGVCATGREYFGEGAIALLTAALPAGCYVLFDGLRDGRDALRARTRAWAGGGEGALAVVHADPRLAAAEAVARLGADTGAFLVGGLGSSAVNPLQLAGGPTEGGLSGVLLSPELPVLTGLSQGCAPIGPRHRVTACHRNLVLALDDRPALEVLTEEVGELLARDLRRIGGYIHAALPVPGSDRGGDYLVRNLLGVDRDRGVLAIGDELRVGQELLFVKRDGASAQEDLRRMLADLDRRRAGRPVRGALYHTCLARGPNMFGPDSAELGMIQRALGDVPLAGFFANGEIFHDRLYTYTGVLTLFL